MNFIISAQPTTDITSKTAQILKAMKVDGYPFSGKTPSVSFRLCYPSDDSFHELTTLHNRIKPNKRFKNNYFGLVEVDISDWIGCEHDDRFVALLDYSERNTAIFTFIVRTPEKEASEKIIQIIKSLSTKTIVIECNMKSCEKSERKTAKISLIKEEDKNEVI